MHLFKYWSIQFSFSLQFLTVQFYGIGWYFSCRQTLVEVSFMFTILYWVVWAHYSEPWCFYFSIFSFMVTGDIEHMCSWRRWSTCKATHSFKIAILSHNISNFLSYIFYEGGQVSYILKCRSQLVTEAFAAHAPRLWNTLPIEIWQVALLSSLKSILKTFLYRKAFMNI